MGRYRADSCLCHVAAWIRSAGAVLRPDRGQAEAFLTQLDRHARGFSFRTFSDTPYTCQGAVDPLQRAIHGSLNERWRELVELNRAGAAIAVTINQTDCRGRTALAIRRVRALFLDDDRGISPQCFELPPHLRVLTSEGHNHYYWLVSDLALSDFSRYQRRLAVRYGGDHRVAALNQAMQLPGFWRRKQVTQPRMPGFEALYEGSPYRSTQLRQLLGLLRRHDATDASGASAV
jgi:hypothetical protein